MIVPDRGVVQGLRDDQLLWVDIDRTAGDDFDDLREAFALDPTTVRLLGEERTRAAIHRREHYVHLTLEAVEGPDDTLDSIVQQQIDLLAGKNWVITVHDGRVRAFDSFVEQVSGETRIGELDAASLMAALVDSQLASYFRIVETIEQELDHLDERALRSNGTDDLLVDMVRLRRRVATLRRTLAPHREVFAPLARPDFELHEEVGSVWPGLVDRLERTMDSVENVRELLVGTFDIHMGRLAQRTNDVMKLLTVLSALLLPGVVLAGVMGMNFRLGFFDDPANFWLVLGAMVALAAVILVVARWRRWI